MHPIFQLTRNRSQVPEAADSEARPASKPLSRMDTMNYGRNSEIRARVFLLLVLSFIKGDRVTLLFRSASS